MTPTTTTATITAATSTTTRVKAPNDFRPPDHRAPEASTPEDRAPEELAGEIDAAQARLELLTGEQRVLVSRLTTAHADLHRAGLVRMIRALRADPRGKELLFELVDDPVVRLLLLTHGIIRPDPETLARRVLDGVRPQLRFHGGDVTLDHLDGDVAWVRLAGACNGCSMAAVTLREGVERALTEGVPGLRAVEVVPAEHGPAVIPLSSVGVRPGSEAGWVRAGGLDEFVAGTVRAVRLQPDDGPGAEALVVTIGDRLTAFVNACAHQGRRLDDAILDPSAATLTCSGHGFCYDALSGECLSLPGAQLEPLPLRVDGRHVWIRAVR